MTWCMVLLVSMLPQAVTPSVTCRSVGLEPPRQWRVERRGDGWQIVHWRAGPRRDEARVSLPASADVQLSATRVEVKARTSNGGVDVALHGTPANATLDIYVSFELEVNVDASLTPAIDHLNTDGPIGVRCEVAAQQP